jgi:hypothetical protein
MARHTFSLVVGVALWAIPTIASAHGGNDDPNVVHVCIGNVSKVVRSVGVNGSCIAGPPVVAETPEHWPKTALAGPKGDKGDPGVPGANGTNGLDGASVTFVGYFTGNQNGCANGGAIYTAGNPPVPTYVCNGSNGADGTAGTRADPPCFDNFNRYVDCGNGTVTDTVTGLIWLKQWDCLGSMNWAAANQAAAGLKHGDCSLTDQSSPGDWRLPTHAEWQATLAQALGLGCVVDINEPPLWTNDAGTACYDSGAESSFAGLSLIGYYWSSTTETSTSFTSGPPPANAVLATLLEPINPRGSKVNAHRVWPVRRGSR